MQCTEAAGDDDAPHANADKLLYCRARAHFNFCLLILVGRKHGTHCIWLTQQCCRVAEPDGLQYRLPFVVYE